MFSLLGPSQEHVSGLWPYYSTGACPIPRAEVAWRLVWVNFMSGSWTDFATLANGYRAFGTPASGDQLQSKVRRPWKEVRPDDAVLASVLLMLPLVVLLPLIAVLSGVFVLANFAGRSAWRSLVMVVGPEVCATTRPGGLPLAFSITMSPAGIVESGNYE